MQHLIIIKPFILLKKERNFYKLAIVLFLSFAFQYVGFAQGNANDTPLIQNINGVYTVKLNTLDYTPFRLDATNLFNSEAKTIEIIFEASEEIIKELSEKKSDITLDETILNECIENPQKGASLNFNKTTSEPVRLLFNNCKNNNTIASFSLNKEVIIDLSFQTPKSKPNLVIKEAETTKDPKTYTIHKTKGNSIDTVEFNFLNKGNNTIWIKGNLWSIIDDKATKISVPEGITFISGNNSFSGFSIKSGVTTPIKIVFAWAKMNSNQSAFDIVISSYKDKGATQSLNDRVIISVHPTIGKNYMHYAIFAGITASILFLMFHLGRFLFRKYKGKTKSTDKLLNKVIEDINNHEKNFNYAPSGLNQKIRQIRNKFGITLASNESSYDGQNTNYLDGEQSNKVKVFLEDILNKEILEGSYEEDVIRKIDDIRTNNQLSDKQKVLIVEEVFLDFFDEEIQPGKEGHTKYSNESSSIFKEIRKTYNIELKSIKRKTKESAIEKAGSKTEPKVGTFIKTLLQTIKTNKGILDLYGEKVEDAVRKLKEGEYTSPIFPMQKWNSLSQEKSLSKTPPPPLEEGEQEIFDYLKKKKGKYPIQIQELFDSQTNNQINKLVGELDNNIVSDFIEDSTTKSKIIQYINHKKNLGSVKKHLNIEPLLSSSEFREVLNIRLGSYKKYEIFFKEILKKVELKDNTAEKAIKALEDKINQNFLAEINDLKKQIDSLESSKRKYKNFAEKIENQLSITQKKPEDGIKYYQKIEYNLEEVCNEIELPFDQFQKAKTQLKDYIRIYTEDLNDRKKLLESRPPTFVYNFQQMIEKMLQGINYLDKTVKNRSNRQQKLHSDFDFILGNSQKGLIQLNRLLKSDNLPAEFGYQVGEKDKLHDVSPKDFFAKIIKPYFLDSLDKFHALYAYRWLRVTDKNMELNVADDFIQDGINLTILDQLYGYINHLFQQDFGISLMEVKLGVDSFDKENHKKYSFPEIIAYDYPSLQGDLGNALGAYIIYDIIEVGYKDAKTEEILRKPKVCFT